MTEQKLIELARKEGFTAVMIEPGQIPINPKFRVYCEENLCGKYNANYSCPPDCGTVEELQEKILAENKIMVIQTIWNIKGYEDTDTIHRAKESHNAAALRLKDAIFENGYFGFCSSYSGCHLCSPCKRVLNLPCAFPEKRISCLSAYCVDVAKLAERCGMPFAWSSEKLHLFGMIAFHKT